MNIIIAGSRNFMGTRWNKRFFSPICKASIDNLNKFDNSVVIFSGGASGPDTMAEIFAEDHGYQFVKFAADWKVYGRAAGPIRNKKMANDANALIAFWDGESRGTKNMIQIARDLGLKCIVINVYGEV